jgi:hypothetical protein
MVKKFSGALEHLPLPDIFEYLSALGKTGVLSLSSGQSRKRLFVSGGKIVFASSNLPEDRLGDILLRQGAVSRIQYDESVRRMRQSGIRQGQALVEMKAISPEALWTAVREQIRRIVRSLFEWERGEVFFEEGPLPPGESITANDTMAGMLAEGMRSLESPSLIEKLAPAPDAVLSCRGEEASLTPPERHMLSLLDGKKTVAELLRAGSIGRNDALRALAVLSTLGLAFVEPAAPAAKDGGAAKAAPPETAILPLRTLVEEHNAAASFAYRRLLAEVGPLAQPVFEKFWKETLTEFPEEIRILESAPPGPDAKLPAEALLQNVSSGPESLPLLLPEFLRSLRRRQNEGLRRIFQNS